MSVDWGSFGDEIQSLLEEMGSEIVVLVPSTIRDSDGKKITTNNSYTGVAVMGSYDSESMRKSDMLIQTGDVKFISRFNDSSFEPTEKMNAKLVFGNKNYSIISVTTVSPDGGNTVIRVIQGRRVN